MKQHSPDTIQLITEWLTQQSTIQLAILFGSFAKGSPTKNSDIDLAIELDSPLTTDKKLSILQSLGEITDRKIDLIDLKTVGEPLLSQVIKHAKILKDNKSKFIDLSIKNVYMMEDFTPYIQRTIKQRQRRLLNE